MDFSKKSHVEEYFLSIKSELNVSKIKSVFSLSSLSLSVSKITYTHPEDKSGWVSYI